MSRRVCILLATYWTLGLVIALTVITTLGLTHYTYPKEYAAPSLILYMFLPFAIMGIAKWINKCIKRFFYEELKPKVS